MISTFIQEPRGILGVALCRPPKMALLQVPGTISRLLIDNVTFQGWHQCGVMQGSFPFCSICTRITDQRL